MADLLKTGVVWLDGERRSHLSRTVTYRRGMLTASVLATTAATSFEQSGQDGMIIRGKQFDFIISAADLTSTFNDPEIGDRIVDGTDIYEVLDLGGAGHFRPADAYGIALRIHTKRVFDGN